MKKIYFMLTVILIAAFAFSLLGCAPEQPPATTNGETPPAADESPQMDPVTLTYAHWFSTSHPIHTDWAEGWATAIEKATDGLVKIDVYPAETLMSATEIYDGVVDGSIDIGTSCYCYNVGRFPVMEAFIQPGILYQSDMVASTVVWDLTQDLEPEELQDTKHLMILATGPGAIWSKNPIKKLEDIQGMEIRTTGLDAPKLAALGATPVGMPQPEGYEALQRGVVEANLGPTDIMKSFRQAEVVDYVTMTPFIYNCLYYTTINHAVWNSFPPQIQEIIWETTEQMARDVGRGLMDRQNDEGLRWSVEEIGVEVIHLPDEEQQRWIDQLQPLQNDWVERVEAMGIPGREILDKVINLAQHYDEVYH